MAGFGCPWGWGSNNCYNDNCASCCGANYDRDNYAANCSNVNCNQREIFYQKENCYNANNATCCANRDSACCNNYNNRCTNGCCNNYGGWGPIGCGGCGPCGYGGCAPYGLPGPYGPGPQKWYGKYYGKPVKNYGYGAPVSKLQRGMGYNKKKWDY